MECKVCWMYHDIMDLYGDKGNIMTLKKRCLDRDIDFKVTTCAIGQEEDLSSYDLVFLGGGADKEQMSLIPDLLSRKENIQKALDEKTFFLLICGGYQLFGQYYLDQDGKKIEGLNIFDYYTESTDRDHRCIGNIVVETTINNETFKIVGFENHGGQTKNVSSPLGKVLSGHGNTYNDGTEGFMNDDVIATYMHGPLLPKNPKIADILLERALKKRHGHVELEELDDTLENKAREVMLNRLLKK